MVTASVDQTARVWAAKSGAQVETIQGHTEQGRAGLQSNRREICRYLWQQVSPSWMFTDETFNRTAPSFDNPDFVDVVIHSYRHRIGNAPGESASSSHAACHADLN